MKPVFAGATRNRRISWPLGLLAAFALAPSVLARPLAEILKSNELRACIFSEAPAVASATPPGCRDRCQFSGPVVEEVLAFARHLGKDMRVRTLRVDWDEQFFDASGKTDREASYTPQLLASGRCDLYPSNLTKNAWRLKKLDFVTLFPSRMMVVAHVSTKARLRAVVDLAGQRAAVVKNSSYHTWLEEQNAKLFATKPVRIELVATTDEATQAVDAGKVDFTLLDSDGAIWTTRHQLKQAHVAFPVGPKDEIGWAFRKQDKDLQAAVAEFFVAQKSRDDSEFNQIWTRHLGLGLNKFIAVVNSTP